MKNENINTSKYLQLTGENKKTVKELQNIIGQIVNGDINVSICSIETRVNNVFEIMYKGRRHHFHTPLNEDNDSDLTIRIDYQGNRNK